MDEENNHAINNKNDNNISNSTTSNNSHSSSTTAEELKNSLLLFNRGVDGGDGDGGGGLVIDIDETLAATNIMWFQRCMELFGNPVEETGCKTVHELINKYHLAQNNPVWSKQPIAMKWMQEQRDTPSAQDNLPIINGAIDGMNELITITSIVGYLTVRPTSVYDNTKRWLKQCGFPDLPIIMKPIDIPFQDGNKWKANTLHDLYPQVIGIVDDNPKVPIHAGITYPGTIYLFGHETTLPEYKWAIPCPTWKHVIDEVVRKKEKIRTQQKEKQNK